MTEDRQQNEVSGVDMPLKEHRLVFKNFCPYCSKPMRRIFILVTFPQSNIFEFRFFFFFLTILILQRTFHAPYFIFESNSVIEKFKTSVLENILLVLPS